MVLARMWFPLAVATLGTALLIMTLSISLRFRGVPSLREGAVAATGAIPLRYASTGSCGCQSSRGLSSQPSLRSPVTTVPTTPPTRVVTTGNGSTVTSSNRPSTAPVYLRSSSAPTTAIAPKTSPPTASTQPNMVVATCGANSWNCINNNNNVAHQPQVPGCSVSKGGNCCCNWGFNPSSVGCGCISSTNSSSTPTIKSTLSPSFRPSSSPPTTSSRPTLRPQTGAPSAFSSINNSGLTVAPYFYMWGYGNSDSYQVSSLMDARTKANLTAATLAFVISDGGCGLYGNFLDTMLDDIKAFLAVGGHLVISFGGANGPYLEDSCTDINMLFSVIDGLIQRSGIYSLDFDVEGGYIANTVISSRRNAMLKLLQAKYPQLVVSFTLPVLPSGLDYNGVNLMQGVVASGVTVNLVNLMTMDYYQTVAGKTEGQLAVSAGEATLSQLRPLFPSKTSAELHTMIGITPMIGVNDDRSVFTLSDAQTVRAYALQNGIGRLSYWAFQRDQAQATGNPNDLSTKSGVVQSNFAYWRAFTGQ